MSSTTIQENRYIIHAKPHSWIEHTDRHRHTQTYTQTDWLTDIDTRPVLCVYVWGLFCGVLLCFAVSVCSWSDIMSLPCSGCYYVIWPKKTQNIRSPPSRWGSTDGREWAEDPRQTSWCVCSLVMSRSEYAEIHNAGRICPGLYVQYIHAEMSRRPERSKKDNRVT